MQIERAQIQLTPDQFERALEMQTKFLLPLAIFGSLFGTPVLIFFSGLVFWGIGLISKEEQQWTPTYYHGLVVAAIPTLATVPYTLLGILMTLLGRVGTMRPDQLIPSSIGYWVQPDNPRLSMLLCSMDLFLLFQYVLIYFAAKYALRTKTWGACLCAALSLLGPCFRIFLAK
ncbi:MAG: hypothetical protein LBH03_07540 [Holophagales bacterium]|jgi:hypothetical protein|nr:hypothetical protein [Holophagales bacterium]